jgi:para-nitrobenzyl esterase
VQNNDVFEFRKIPFAKPPIGKLRFEKPEKYGIWPGTLDATKFGPSCYQTLGLEKDILPNKNISEDCLHLNIYVPVNISCNSDNTFDFT